MSVGAVDTLSAPTLPTPVIDALWRILGESEETPYRMGLLPTGMVEAEIAAAYVTIAGRDSTNVRAMRTNMANVVHAIDPSLVQRGAGLGFGFRRAAEGVRLEVRYAAADPGASPALLYHAPFVEDAATNALALADDAVTLARRIERSQEDAETTLELLEDLADVVRAMAHGRDADRDGRIGHAADESGLARAGHHLMLVSRVERLATPRPLPESLPIPRVPRDTTGVGR